jgi:peptidoglycan hydrolase CwlO-like protein
MLIQIPGTKLYRDTESMALLNKDTSGLEEYRMKRQLIQSQKEEINKVKSEIASVKEDINEIKHLLVKLLDKGSNG